MYLVYKYKSGTNLQESAGYFRQVTFISHLSL